MGTPAIKAHVLQAAVDALAKCGDQVSAAAEVGVPRSTMQSRLREAQRRGFKPSVGLEDPDNAAHMRLKVKRLEGELRQTKEKALDEQAIRAEVFKLADSVTDVEPPSWVVEPSGPQSSPGVPTLFCSDWHWAEVVKGAQINGVNNYNVAIAKERVKALVTSAIDLLKIVDPQMRYPGIVLPLGGDMVSGNIHDELTATNQFNTMPTVLDLFGVLVWVVEELLKHFPRIFVPCVGGNHGRDTHKIWNKDRHATSFDWLIYNFLAKRFEHDKRVTFLIPDGPDAYYRIYGHRYLLTHGDQFRGGDGMIGALGPIIRGDHRKRSRNAQVDMEYDTMLLGHWHQYIHLTRLIVNGSLKGYDEYAYNNNFGFEPPQQALWLTHPKHGITFRMPVQVDRKRAAPKTEWVSVAA